jgi:hypothetical protein
MTKFIMFNLDLCEYDQKFVENHNLNSGWVSVVIVPTCCELDGRKIETHWGQDFLCPSRLAVTLPTRSPSRG